MSEPAASPPPTGESAPPNPPAAGGPPPTPGGVGTDLAPPESAPSGPPPPPRGPGVQLPFAAPPRDRNAGKLAAWILVLVFGGGAVILGLVVGVAAVGVWATSELSASASDEAEEFLDNLGDSDYSAAYDQLCAPLQRDLDLAEFREEWRPVGVVAHELDAVDASGDDLVVPATVTNAAGERIELKLAIALNQDADMTVCGWTGLRA